MKKHSTALSIVAEACLVLAASSRAAHTNQLEQRVDKLETRVAVLESQMAARAARVAERSATRADGTRG